MQKLNSSDEIISLEHHLNELKKSNRLEDDYNNTSTVLQTRLERLIKVKEEKQLKNSLEYKLLRDCEYTLVLPRLMLLVYLMLPLYKRTLVIQELKQLVTTVKSLILRTVLMVDSITFGQEMVNILVSGKEYDKVFNHLDMLNAPLEGKGFTYTKQAKPYYYS
ncbi:hypothetical protein Tco_1414214 [Tanacetum coccineum]